ncbi:MAG: hypothetical protein R3E56_10605 [Burkholderiaceae bacterium]
MCRRASSTFAAIGVEIVAERHLGICVNHDFALVPPQQLRQMIEEVAQSRAPGHLHLLHQSPCRRSGEAPWRRELKASTLLDTVSTTVWGMLRAIRCVACGGAALGCVVRMGLSAFSLYPLAPV